MFSVCVCVWVGKYSRIQHASREEKERVKKNATEMFHYFLTLHMNMWRVSYHRNRIKKIWGNLIMITKYNELQVTTSKWLCEWEFHWGYLSAHTHSHRELKPNFVKARVIKGIGYSRKYNMLTCTPKWFQMHSVLLNPSYIRNGFIICWGK